VAPDFNPTAPHADYYVPVRIGADVALANSMSQVIIEENLVHWKFVQEQTDLPLLVRLDNNRFLRAKDVDGAGTTSSTGTTRRNGRSLRRRAVPSPLRTQSGAQGRLYGDAEARQEGQGHAGVRAAQEDARRAVHTREGAGAQRHHPELVRTIARKAAKKRTRMLMAGTPASTTTATSWSDP